MAEVAPMMRARDRRMRCGVQGHSRCAIHNTGGARERHDEAVELARELADELDGLAGSDALNGQGPF